MSDHIRISVGILLAGVLLSLVVWQLLTQAPAEQALQNRTKQTMEQKTAQQPPMGMMNNNPMQVTSEREFITQMVPHHEEAIATAGEVLQRGGTSQDMIDLAENIISSQTTEVALMKDSYKQWYGQPYQETDTYAPMMRDLTPYSGAELDGIFLHDMTMHHMGAIMMSRFVQPHLEHEVMETLTTDIIANQSREIQTMQQIFAALQNRTDTEKPTS